MSKPPASGHPIANASLADALDHRSLWDRAERFAGIGTWGWSPHTDELVCSANLLRLVGYEPGEVDPSTDRLLARMHPDDVHGVRRQLERARRGDDLPPMGFRVLLADGSVRHMETIQTVEHGHGGDGERRLLGFARDVSEERGAERALAVAAAAAAALAAWESPAAGAQRLLREIACAADASAAALWVPQEGALAALASWSGPALGGDGFARHLSERRPVRGTGPVGLACEHGQPVVCARAPEEPAPPGLAGVRATVAIPAVDEDGRVAAVLAIYAAAPLEAGQHMMRAFAEVGAQLGAFLARRPGALAPLALTARELEVLELAAEGLAGQEIQARLSVSHSTVKSHLEHIYAKLGVSNRVAAVARALREGLIE